MCLHLRPLRLGAIRSPGTWGQPPRNVYNALPETGIQLQHYQTESLTKSHPTPLPNPPDTQTIILPDGRSLGYAEYGSPNGATLLYFHGFPMSRLEAYGIHGIAARRKIRLLSLDRPGFGLSTHDPHRHIMDWPADVQAFAAKVGISQFSVLGVSGGGPYALACAEHLPRGMLSAVGVLAGAPLWDRGFWTEGVPWYSRPLYLAANYWPSGLRVVSDALVGTLRWMTRMKWVERKIDAALEPLTKAQAAQTMEEKSKTGNVELAELPPTNTYNAPVGDKQQEPVQSIAQQRKTLIRLIFEGFGQGSSGFIHETRLLTRHWGFNFEDVTHDNVRMWHGSKDANAPVGSIRDMAKRMPHCVLKEYNENHYTMGNYVEEVLKELIPENRDV